MNVISAGPLDATNEDPWPNQVVPPRESGQLLVGGFEDDIGNFQRKVDRMVARIQTETERGKIPLTEIFPPEYMLTAVNK